MKICVYLFKENKELRESNSKTPDTKLRQKYNKANANIERLEAKVKKLKSKNEKLTKRSNDYTELLQKIAAKQY